LSSQHYVNNKKLLQELTEYKKKYNEAVEKGKPLPEIPRYVAECILAINERLALKPNFANYPFVDEMKSDGIENCILYLYNYDPEKYQNPFAYLTTISWYAFIRRIQKEKRQLYIKLRATQHQLVFDEAISRQHHEDGRKGGANQLTQITEFASDFITEYEEGMKRKKKKATS